MIIKICKKYKYKNIKLLFKQSEPDMWAVKFPDYKSLVKTKNLLKNIETSYINSETRSRNLNFLNDKNL